MKHVIEIRSLVNTLRKIFVKDYRFLRKEFLRRIIIHKMLLRYLASETFLFYSSLTKKLLIVCVILGDRKA